MLRVSYCLDRLFELIGSGGVTTGFISGLQLYMRPLTLLKFEFSIRLVSGSVQCTL